MRVYYWPLYFANIEEHKPYSYDIHIDHSPISDIKFTYCNKYMIVSCDNGNLYIIESFKIVNGVEMSREKQMSEEQVTTFKKREFYGFSGYSIMDDISLIVRSEVKVCSLC